MVPIFAVSSTVEVMKLQKMFNPGCSPAEYHEQGKSFTFPDLSSDLCPVCKADFLKKHGFYTRYLITLDFEGTIAIRRYCCHICCKTVSLLPSFCHPKRAYGIFAIFGILEEYYVKATAVCHAVACFLAEKSVSVSRQLLNHYRKRIEKNLNSLIMAVTAIQSLRAPPVTEKANTGEKVRQLFLRICSPTDTSLKIFELTRTTYLTPHAL
jgi:hypothetical protein